MQVIDEVIGGDRAIERTRVIEKAEEVIETEKNRPQTSIFFAL
jgi:hypothetical protein